MQITRFQNTVTELLSSAGIEINGSRPWDLQIHNDKFYQRVLAEGSLGAGESYVLGWWDCARLDEFFNKVFRSNIEGKFSSGLTTKFQILLSKVFNKQRKQSAISNGQHHYDIGNDLFVHMLGKRMTYTCAYWKGASDLDEAQEQKLDITCRKLGLKPGMSVLDIGCGWGSFATFAAEKYDAHVTGITVSKDQTGYANNVNPNLPVSIELMDYRDISGKYDRIVSLGMFEHVGYKNYRRFMRIVHRCLKDGGLFLLHTIGGNTSETTIDPWINKYIFPGAMLPSIKQIGKAIEGLFVMEDWHNFSADYDRTLMAWHQNFVRNWEKIRDHYSDDFFRLWSYYLLMCAGTFRARKNQLWQIVLSKNGVVGGYQSVR